MSDGIGNSMPLWEQRQLKIPTDITLFEESREVVGISAQQLFGLMYNEKYAEEQMK